MSLDREMMLLTSECTYMFFLVIFIKMSVYIGIYISFVQVLL